MYCDRSCNRFQSRTRLADAVFFMLRKLSELCFIVLKAGGESRAQRNEAAQHEVHCQSIFVCHLGP